MTGTAVIALVRRALTPRRTGQRGLTIVELCVVIAILAILLVVGVAALLSARMVSNESAAIGALRSINNAQLSYLTGCGAGGYATSFVILGTRPSPDNQGYISEDLGSSVNPSDNGYAFSLHRGAGGSVTTSDCNGNPTQTKYYATAAPVVFGETGSRSFATNQAGTIWQASGSTPPDEPFAPPDQLAK